MSFSAYGPSALAIDGQMGEELIDILGGRGAWVLPASRLFLKMEKAGNPLNVSELGADRHMPQTHQLSDLIQ